MNLILLRLILCMKILKSNILIADKEVEMMEKARKRIRFCLCFVVLTAIVIGLLYYYGQLSEQSSMNEGTLISGLRMELRQLCR